MAFLSVALIHSRRRHGSAFMIATTFIGAPLLVGAQNNPPRAIAESTYDTGSSIVPLGTKLLVRSKVLHETREVIVSTPPSYSRAGERFPVLYVLDGSQNLLTSVSASRALASAGRMPQAIVVAIVNTQRDRDFTPKLVRTHELPPGVSTIGGADTFLQFIRTELIPTIDSKYRTQPMRTIIGHSLGGLLAMHALATSPQLFRAYITLEPSLWWDAREPVHRVLDSLRARPTAIGRLVAVEGTSDEGWRPDWDALRKAAPASFRTSFVHIENESHENLPYRGIYEGLASLFSDYVPAMSHDLARATLPALTRQYAAMSQDFGYAVKPPLSAILRIADGEANQRRFDSARRALALADSLYPGTPDVRTFRDGVEASAAEAARTGVGPVRPAINFKPTSVAEAARFLGGWNAVVRVIPGSAMNGAAVFSLSGDSLLIRFVTQGVALDGGDLLEPPQPVRVEGDSVFWERENLGGGRAVTSARLTANGKIEGEETLVGGRPMPAGFTPPRAFVELKKR
jgi:predicted alpha/beta superfamily hydrolase